MRVLYFFLIVIMFGCANAQQEELSTKPELQILDSIFKVPEGFVANSFNYPVGESDANGYYNAQKFGKNTHLGDDWNGMGGGNSDLGDPVYTVANGFVTYAKDHNESWGNVIRIVHFLPDSSQVESLFAHCNEILVKAGEWVLIGDQIGTIGTAHGNYRAHLHLEMRDEIGMSVGGGYGTDTEGYLDPTKFIESHRIIMESD